VFPVLLLAGAVLVYVFLTALHARPSLPTTGLRPPPPLRTAVSIKLPTAVAPASVEQLRKESEREATELMRRYPASPGALHLAATYFFEVKQNVKAAEIWERCIALAPAYAGPRVGLASAAMELGDDERALAILEDALSAGCRTADLFYQLGAVLERIGRLEQAEAALREGVGSFPDHVDLWGSLGQVQLQRGNLREAQASLEEAIRRRPDDSEAHFALISVFARLGEVDRSEEHRRRFDELKAETPLAKHRFQEVYDAVLRHIVFRTLANVGSEYQRQGDLETAERLYLRSLELNPRAADPCRWLAGLYHSQGRIGDAQVVQQRLVALEPDHVENYLNLASLSLQLGRLAEAEAVLVDAARVAPHSPAPYAALGRLYLQQGRNQEAQAFAEKAAQLEATAGTP
jgi:tetratricopeptide (TPR) repeat protein